MNDSRERHRRQSALVVGGGIGGLLASVALAARFERVTIVERDPEPERGLPRSGAPQGRCLHMLLGAGLRAFEALVPGLTDALVTAGGLPFDVGAASRLRLASGWLPRFESDIRMVACSRALLEWVLHERVSARAGLRLIHGRRVRGLCARDGRVTGARVESGTEHEEVLADLTVVVGGRRCALPTWLTELGIAPVDEDQIDARHRYVSRWFAIPERAPRDRWKLLSIAPTPTAPAGGAVFEAEGRRWGVVLLVPEGVEVPSSDQALLEVAASLPDPALHDAIADARPISAIVRHGYNHSRVRRFETASDWPAGLVALGDVVCAFDPLFGLGMTACARGVLELKRCLERAPGELDTREFQRRLAQRNESAWTLVGEHRDQTDARETYYRECLLRLAPSSPTIARALIARMHLLDEPDVIRGPDFHQLVHRELERVARADAASPT